MSFLYPLALLGLIAIPILIIIYILRNKYKEETAPTTYLWEIAAKILKRKNPLSRFEHLLALIMQCLAITVFSLALAHPIFTLKEQADNIAFIIDSSSSMSMVHEEKSRFDTAKEKILEKASEAAKGSTFTLISAEKEPRIVCQSIDDYSRLEMYINNLKITENSAYIADSVAIAQTLFSDGKCNVCYLATDQNCENIGEQSNINIINCGDNEENYSFVNLTYKIPLDEEGRRTNNLSFTGTVKSFASDKELEVEYFLNDKSLGVKTYACVAGVDYTFKNEVFGYNGEKISTIKAVIKQEDALMKDNEFFIYENENTVKTTAMIVSANPKFFEAAFNALKNIEYTVVNPSRYRERAGFDLYVFDSYTPASLPGEGTSWIFAPDATIPGSGFEFVRTINSDNGSKLSFANNDDSLQYSQLTRSLSKNRDMYVNSYKQFKLKQDFTTIMTCEGLPVVFAGRNENACRQVVWAFDLHNSNLPVLYDFVVLMRNFIDYSNPRVITSYQYEVGDSAIFSIPDAVNDGGKILITSPDGSKAPLRFRGSEDYAYEIKQIGQYIVDITYSDGSTKQLKFYSHMSAIEQDPRPLAETQYALVITENTVKGDGLWDNILPIVIAAALFFAGDWILYTHEQY